MEAEFSGKRVARQQRWVYLAASLSSLSGRDLRQLRGHPSCTLEAAMAGERNSALPHPSPGRQPESP